ncbi:hypothetical protein ABT297_41190, partial [Dactylosporangium sp. NPDC000555]
MAGAPIPAGVGPAEAAALALTGLTARQALPLAGRRAGARPLVTGAGGEDAGREPARGRSSRAPAARMRVGRRAAARWASGP